MTRSESKKYDSHLSDSPSYMISAEDRINNSRDNTSNGILYIAVFEAAEMSFAHAIFVPDPYHADAIALLQSRPNCRIIQPNDNPTAHWHELADGVLIRSETRLTEEDFAKQKRLRVVVKQGVGVNNVDLEAAKKHGVMVCTNTPGLNSESVADLKLGLALTFARRVFEVDRRIRNDEKIILSQILGMSLFQKTIGIVGM